MKILLVKYLPNEQLSLYLPKNSLKYSCPLEEVFGPMFEAMLNGEMESYLGYEPNSQKEKETTNWRNGYFDKTIKTSMGETAIEVPRLRISGEYEKISVKKA